MLVKLYFNILINLCHFFFHFVSYYKIFVTIENLLQIGY